MININPSETRKSENQLLFLTWNGKCHTLCNTPVMYTRCFSKTKNYEVP